MELDMHRQLALRGMLVITPIVWIAHCQTIMGWIASLPAGGALTFLFNAVAATTILWYTLLLTLLILGPTSHQLQYLIPMMGLISIVLYYITTVP